MTYSVDSASRFVDAFDRMGTIAVFSDDLKFESVAPSFHELLGYDDQTVIGASFNVFDFEGASSLKLMQMVRHLYSGGTWVGDVMLRHRDGTPKEIRLTISPSIKNGVIMGYLAFYQRSYVQHSAFDLDDVLYRYRSGFNKIVALAIVTSTGEVQEVNDLFTEMFGFSRKQILGRHIGMLTRQDHLTEIPPNVWEVVSKGEIFTGEVEVFKDDGTSVFVRQTVTPANTGVPEVIASFDTFLVIYQDITKESEMRTYQNELAVEAAKQQMLNGAIHNISNLQQGVLAANSKTLNGAQGLASAFEVASTHLVTLTNADDRNPFLAGMSRIIKDSVSHILDSVREEREAIDETVAVLNSFRREQKNIRVVDDESISAFVQRILNRFSLQAARHNIAVSISSMIDRQVRWPTAQVHQIVFNLLINAQQAIEEQVERLALPAHRGRIELAILEEGKDILFYVKDNGGGFHVPLAKLFTPRFTTKAAGCGIGLHTSSIMAQSMGGSLTAENSAINHQPGAQFLLRIPRLIEAKGKA